MLDGPREAAGVVGLEPATSARGNNRLGGCAFLRACQRVGALNWESAPDNCEEHDSPMRLAKHRGHWVLRFASGNSGEGPYDEVRDGGRVWTSPDGQIEEGHSLMATNKADGSAITARGSAKPLGAWFLAPGPAWLGTAPTTSCCHAALRA